MAPRQDRSGDLWLDRLKYKCDKTGMMDEVEATMLQECCSANRWRVLSLEGVVKCWNAA